MFLGGAKLVLGGGKTTKKISRFARTQKDAVLSKHIYKRAPPEPNPVYAPANTVLAQNLDRNLDSRQQA